MFDRAGKLLVWYADGQTCSAGLAWAVAADVIVVPPEARFGSVGVIAELKSQKKAVEKLGVAVELVTSGERKADGHPLNEITEDVIEAVQSSVTHEAELFYAWVSERRGIPVETIRSWEAGIFHGAEAVAVGLADECAGEAAALAMVAGADLSDAPVGVESDDDMKPKSLAASARAALGMPSTVASASSAESEDFDAIRKRLGKMASEDSDAGRKARKALDAIDEQSKDEGEEGDEEKPEKHDEPDGDEGEDSGDSDASAASAAEDEDDGDDASAAEDEEASAKSCEDDAKKAEADAADEDAKATAALASGAKDCAKVALGHLNRAKALRATSKGLRSRAKMHRKLSAQSNLIVKMATQLDRVTSAVARIGKPNAATAAIGAKGTQGSAPGATKPKSANPLAGVSENVLRAARLTKKSQAFIEDSDGEDMIGLPSPAEARAIFESTKAQVAELKGVTRG
jgi:ClpP class serine protease